MGRVSDLDRTAFVTGAATGLGREFARMLLAEGVTVWGTSRDPARLADLAHEYPGRFHPVALDLRNIAGGKEGVRGGGGTRCGLSGLSFEV